MKHIKDNRTINFRYNIFDEDKDDLMTIVLNSENFSEQDITVAEEVIKDAISKGADDSGYSFVITEDSGRAIGFIVFGLIPCTESSYDIYWLVVDKKYRGMGYGKQLLQKAEESIKSIKGSRIFIETSSKKSYEDARRFYYSNGYLLESEIKDFYSKNDNKLIFSKYV